MSYAALDEAFPSVGPATSGIKQKVKKHKKNYERVIPEPLVIEPDRPAARQPQDVELLRGSPNENAKSTSQSNYLVAAPDPEEDLFPYPLGANDDKSFMLEPTKDTRGLSWAPPDWAAAFSIKRNAAEPKAETPVEPVAHIDGYSTLWEQIPDVKYGGSDNRSGKKTRAIGVEDDLREKVDRILDRLETDTNKLETSRDTFTEILVFVLLGVSIILLIDLFFRSQQSILLQMITKTLKQTGGGRTLRRGTRGRISMPTLLRRLRTTGFI